MLRPYCHDLGPKGSLSKDDDDAEDNASHKMNFYFASEIRDYLNLFGEPMALKTCYSFICNDSGQFQIGFTDLAEVRVSSSNLLTSSVRRISRLEG